jgi:hypothetical protein
LACKALKSPGGASIAGRRAAGLSWSGNYVTMIVAGSLHGPAPIVFGARIRNQVSFPRVRSVNLNARELGNVATAIVKIAFRIAVPLQLNPGALEE